MIGLILMLHFGFFGLLALAWRCGGVAAEPLMLRPTRSLSLADFWGRRWNTGFRTLAHDFVFGPLAPLIGPRGAAAVTFLASGVVHDLVISLPARAGYGLPTLYFLLQFAGLSLERTPRFRRLIARRPFIGRGWTVLVTAAPMPLLLFHGPFIRNVAVPFLKTIGGLS
jgi:D-alanyl-lipoteichoic acid acyltransferase DltB (MBOAT superfamily)